jgi:hypothetical protein
MPDKLFAHKKALSSWQLLIAQVEFAYQDIL